MDLYNSISVVDVITIIIAVYGAGLSSYTIWQQRRDRRPKVVTSMQMAMTPDPTPSGGTFTTYFSVEATNLGQVTVTLGMAGIVFPNNKIFVTTRPRMGGTFPHTLEPGTRFVTLIHIHEVLERLKQEGFSGDVQVIPLYRDQIHRDWRGEPITAKIDEWIERPDMW